MSDVTAKFFYLLIMSYAFLVKLFVKTQISTKTYTVVDFYLKNVSVSLPSPESLFRTQLF